MMRNGSGPEEFFHVIGGRPDLDPDCPICKAQGTGGEKIVSGGPLGDVFLQVLSMGDLLRCPCPLCTKARENGLES